MTPEKIEWKDIKAGDYVEFHFGDTDRISIKVKCIAQDIAYSVNGEIAVEEDGTTAIYRLPLPLPTTPGTMIYNVTFTNTSASYEWAVLLKRDEPTWVSETGSFFYPASNMTFSRTPPVN